MKKLLKAMGVAALFILVVLLIVAALTGLGLFFSSYGGTGVIAFCAVLLLMAFVVITWDYYKNWN